MKKAMIVAAMFVTAMLAASCRDQGSARSQHGATPGLDGASIEGGIGGRGGRAGSGPGGGQGGAGGIGVGGGIGGAGGAGGPSH